MGTKFCQRCYDSLVKVIRLKHGAGKNIFIDQESLTFPCQIPFYETNYRGEPTVRIWDCKVNRYITYSQKDWIAKKNLGEL